MPTRVIIADDHPIVLVNTNLALENGSAAGSGIVLDRKSVV